jgi:hypothetical protein
VIMIIIIVIVIVMDFNDHLIIGKEKSFHFWALPQCKASQ